MSRRAIDRRVLRDSAMDQRWLKILVFVKVTGKEVALQQRQPTTRGEVLGC